LKATNIENNLTVTITIIVTRLQFGHHKTYAWRTNQLKVFPFNPERVFINILHLESPHDFIMISEKSKLPPCQTKFITILESYFCPFLVALETIAVIGFFATVTVLANPLNVTMTSPKLNNSHNTILQQL
jgi:hypothetical protein